VRPRSGFSGWPDCRMAGCTGGWNLYASQSARIVFLRPDWRTCGAHRGSLDRPRLGTRPDPTTRGRFPRVGHAHEHLPNVLALPRWRVGLSIRADVSLLAVGHNHATERCDMGTGHSGGSSRQRPSVAALLAEADDVVVHHHRWPALRWLARILWLHTDSGIGVA